MVKEQPALCPCYLSTEELANVHIECRQPKLNEGIQMLYSFERYLSPDAFQSWFAAARDQATMQLIAASSMQQQMEANVRKAVESSAWLLEREMELPFAVNSANLLTKKKGTQRRRKSVKEPSRPNH